MIRTLTLIGPRLGCLDEASSSNPFHEGLLIYAPSVVLVQVLEEPLVADAPLDVQDSIRVGCGLGLGLGLGLNVQDSIRAGCGED